MKKLVPALVLLPFTAYSTWVVVRHGYVGFLTLAFREPWAMQMLLDLSIAIFLVSGWMRRDARRHDVPVLPYLLALPFLGSVGALAYLVHRNLKLASGGGALAPAIPSRDVELLRPRAGNDPSR